MAATIPKTKPTVRNTNLRALVFAASGTPQPYPVYQFSRGKVRSELPSHNPFKNL